jgi:predicted DNA-binding protein
VTDDKKTDRTSETDAGRDDGSPRKERVLHTRVPAVLEDELKRLATNLKMPVSNVVRAILEDAIEAVEVVGVRAEDELKGFVHRLSEQREAIRQGAGSAVREAARARAEGKEASAPEASATEASPTGPVTDASVVPVPSVDPEPTRCPDADASLDAVIGFQRLVLRAEASCTVCGRLLPKGTEACRGVRDDGGPRVLVGPRCALLPVVDE